MQFHGSRPGLLLCIQSSRINCFLTVVKHATNHYYKSEVSRGSAETTFEVDQRAEEYEIAVSRRYMSYEHCKPKNR